MRVEPDPDRLAAAGVTWLALQESLRSAAARQGAGAAVRDNREMRVEVGPLFRDAGEVASVVVAMRGGRPVYVRDVARVVDGPDEAATPSSSPPAPPARPRARPPAASTPP